MLVYNCLGTQPFNLSLAKKYCISLNTMPANCYTNLGIAFNEARKKKVRIQHRSGGGGRTVCGSGVGTTAAAATASHTSYVKEKAEILKTWEILAFTVRSYEYRR